jgi:hypothetical protein
MVTIGDSTLHDAAGASPFRFPPDFWAAERISLLDFGRKKSTERPA